MRSIGIGLILVLFSLSSTAQNKGTQLSVFFNPGLSWAKTDMQYYESQGTTFSYSYGVDVDFFFSENYAFSTGLHIQNYSLKISYPDTYSPSGSNDDLVSAYSYASNKYKAFEVPAYLKLVSNPIGYNSIFAEFGLSMFFPFRAKQDLISDLGNDSSVNRGSNDIMDDTNFMTVNLLLGAGIQIPFSGSTQFQIGLRYLNGISSISSKNSYRTDGNGSVIQEERDAGQASGPKEKYYSNILAFTLKVVF